MAAIDHVRRCNAHDFSRFRRFVAGGRHVGWVRHDIAGHLAGLSDAFTVTPEAVTLRPDTRRQREQAVDAAAAALAAEIGTPALRGERYRVVERWGAEPVMTIDRGIVTLFGVRAFGIHVNGVVRRADGPHLWIGRRAGDRAVEPGKLDNMIAGGQPAGLGLMDNLVKEAAEEAAVPEALARLARPVGAIGYCFEDQWGLKPDLMFCWDLDLPEDFTPRNTDGEVESFALMPAAEAGRLVAGTDAFKFNVNLVILDFLIRHGLVSPESEPDYVAIVRGLRQGW
jgi:hypothetical protein